MLPMFTNTAIGTKPAMVLLSQMLSQRIEAGDGAYNAHASRCQMFLQVLNEHIKVTARMSERQAHQLVDVILNRADKEIEEKKPFFDAMEAIVIATYINTCQDD